MVVALFGRRIDPEDATTPRFPLEHVGIVRERIAGVLATERAECLICSAACGTDLIALEVARELQIRRRIILPYAREQFRASSVTDRPGDWGPLFDTICDEVAARHDLVVLDTMVSPHEARTQVAQAILGDAFAIARLAGRWDVAPREQVCAVVVWEGQTRGASDHTAEFDRQARERGVRVVEVLTLES